MQTKNQLKQNAQNLANALPALQAETVMQLLEALEKSEQLNATMSEAIGWAVSQDRWIHREENIWEWRESPRGSFRQVLEAAKAGE
ncbi:hypothetical protein FY046_12925 [Erwinia sp. 1181_3]|uniref:hypothetical protein n=1 Tax=Erwinia sp. 1181_3 TaxID=2605957 RepID=UPI004058B52C